MPDFGILPDAPPEVTLVVNGAKYGGWTSVSIRKSMESLADEFTLELTNQRVGPVGQYISTGLTLRDVKIAADELAGSDECEIQIDGKTVIVGYVDDFDFEYDANRADLRVSGRSKTGDLVDCSAVYKTGLWQKATILQIATDLCSPFGIDVLPLIANDFDWLKPFDRFRIDDGETVYETLSRAAEMRALLLRSGNDGSLQIERAGQFSSGAGLELGKNVLVGSIGRSYRERFSEYTFKGQTEASDEWSGLTANKLEHRVTDTGVARYRPMVVHSDKQRGKDDVGKRAVWERNVRAGRSIRHRYTVEEWTSNLGLLWDPNTLVKITDDWCDVDTTALVTSVEFVLAGERVTTLELMDPSAFTAKPEQPPKLKRRGRR
jgi:prophage tail gpP-like protein